MLRPQNLPARLRDCEPQLWARRPVLVVKEHAENYQSDQGDHYSEKRNTRPLRQPRAFERSQAEDADRPNEKYRPKTKKHLTPCYSKVTGIRKALVFGLVLMTS